MRAICFKIDFCYELTYENVRTYVTNKELPKLIENFSTIIVNSLVKYSHKKDFFELINKNKKDTKVLYMVHDFDCICKNNLNLIKNGFFCGLICENCSFYKRNNIKKYRKSWEIFFQHVNEIRVFSESSAEIIKKIYPASESIIKIVPHDIAYIRNYKYVSLQTKELHIGIVGNCNGKAKGEFIVHKFLEYVAKKDIKVSVIGKIKLKNKISSKKITYTGKYQQNELRNILQKQEVNIVFFPSIWPETFSFLVSELIAYGVYICCFNFGAQAQKIKDYSRGFILKSLIPEDMFNQINKYFIEEIK